MRWSKLLRRSTALFLAAATIWILALTADMSAAMESIQALGESPRFVEGILRAELGAAAPPSPGDELGFWQRLVLGQSSRLHTGGTWAARTAEEPNTEPMPAEPVPAPVQEDHTPLPREVKAPEDIVPRTIVPGSSSNTVFDGVFLSNETKTIVLDLAAIAARPIALTGMGQGPQILIIHTHTTEAYTMDGTDVYAESDPYRTIDSNYNTVRVGDVLAEVLTEAGFTVLHDTQLYDYPNYNGAYTRSYAAVEQYLEKFPSISVVLDLHRDALTGADGTVYKVVPDAMLDGASQVQIVVGTEESGGIHPNWADNLALAMHMQGAMNETYPTLARPIALRRSHYNQQLSPGYLLLEVGSHGNTLQEALEAARLFGRAIVPVLDKVILGEE